MVMCVSPITLRKKRPDGFFNEYQVPCGKCEECVSKKHSAFALECVLEARAASSMYFVTLTYRNDTVPIMGRRVFCNNDSFELQESWFEDLHSSKRKLCFRLSKTKMDGSKSLEPFTYVEDLGYCTETAWNEVSYTPSLHREDVRKWLKRCRVRYERESDVKLDFRYVFFGEYGDQTFRPHYHGLLLNLTSDQARFLEESWSKEFGFCKFLNVPAYNPDGSPARVKVAKYVSKYISKNHYYPAIGERLVEAPRRFSSLGFGKNCLSVSDINSLKSFIYAKI